MQLRSGALLVTLAALTIAAVGCQQSKSDPPKPVAQSGEGESKFQNQGNTAKPESPSPEPSTGTAGVGAPAAGDPPAAAGNEEPPPAAAAPNKPDEPPPPGDDRPPGSRDVPAGPPHPFPQRVSMPEFPKDLEWLNTKPLQLADLKGKFVLLDFWTYCCINCIHILPELKKLEHAYPNELVVIGVHSAKFDNEKISENIAAAILRYEIEHPVVNDLNHAYWDSIGISSWPTVLLIDPEGNAIWGRAGEIQFRDVDTVLQLALPYYRAQKLLDEAPLRFDLLAYQSTKTPLNYPGKVVADEGGNRLFISDSNHNRIVVSSLDGQLQTIIGTGKVGRQDGAFDACSFNHPQGMALKDEVLYVADTENHLLRKVDLKAQTVTTIAGTGEQSRFAFPGLEALLQSDAPKTRWVGKPSVTGINSPWDLWVHGDALYIAMAGPHQIWKMPLDESEIGPYAGNGREDIVDGPLLPPQPYELGASSFAQPSGLTSDGTWLYVADSEGSSVRAVPFDTQAEVRTVVGTAKLPYGRLFQFGDQDGERDQVMLQHCLAVAHHEGQIYVADTYNNKIKVINAESGATKTLAGTGQRGSQDDPGEFYEPAGLSIAAGKLYVADTNNHLIRTVDLASGAVSTLTIAGLEPPARPAPTKPSFADAAQIKLEPSTVRLQDGTSRLKVELEFPIGWKLNDLAPLEVWVEAEGDTGPLDRAELGRREITPPATSFELPLKATGTGEEKVTISAAFYYCQTEGALCKGGSVVWQLPLTVAADGPEEPAILKYATPAPALP